VPITVGLRGLAWGPPPVDLHLESAVLVDLHLVMDGRGRAMMSRTAREVGGADVSPFLLAAVREMLPQAGTSTTCEECGFSWLTEGEQALSLVEGAPARFADLLSRGDATIVVSVDVWSPSAYVWHVGDLVRAWAERLHCLGVDPDAPWAGFDPDELAAARHYDALPQAAGPWSLARSVDALTAALEDVDLAVGFDHPEWGHGTVADALRWLAHEVVHHDLDVRRGIGEADAR
jgi:hypothetical protein